MGKSRFFPFWVQMTWLYALIMVIIVATASLPGPHHWYALGPWIFGGLFGALLVWVPETHRRMQREAGIKEEDLDDFWGQWVLRLGLPELLRWLTRKLRP
jgi:hypothetical protein